MVLGGKLGMKSKNKAWKHNSFRNLVANITNCTEKKRNGESVFQDDMSSPRYEADRDLPCHKENASEAIVPNVSKR